jgi:multicomponent Na+:H+ antiporter subunit A
VQYKIDFSDVNAYGLSLVFAMSLAAVLAAFSRTLTTSLLAMGVIGFGITLIYMFYGAPDLAITQILVETLSIVMFMSVVRKLPAFKSFSSSRRKLFDLIFSAVAGVLVTLLVLKAQNLQIGQPVSSLMAELSYIKGHGRNVVNVILVDFRSLDTLAEATVLLIASLGVLVLVRKWKKSGDAV